MATAYVLATHRAPRQVARLVAALRGSRVYLHVDRRTDDSVAAEIISRARQAGDLVVLPRLRSGWASWNLVAVALNGVERAVADGCDHIVSMTGQDYPLRGAIGIDRFLSDFRGISFVARAKIPTEILHQSGGRDRFRRWHQPVRGKRVRLPTRRRPPNGVVPHWNQSQWCLSHDAAADLLDICRQRPEIIRFFRHVWIPDESFVSSVLMPTHADHIVNENLWFARWSPGSAHPTVLTEADFDDLRKASENGSDVGGHARIKLFARKFDEEIDHSILDRIDKELLC